MALRPIPLIVFAWLAGIAAIARPADSPAAPNIVVILADDLGYGDLGSYGHRVLQTPSIDRLASEGLRFTSFYAASPLCSPSRAALLTGRTPFRTGIESWIPENTATALGPREVTVATLLQRRGYQTFLAGKWHLNGGLGAKGQTQPGDHGFEHWLALHAFAIPNHRNPVNFYRDGRPLGTINGFSAQIVTDASIRWLDERRPAVPFFLFVSYPEPHGTIASPDAFNAKYAAYTQGAPDPVVNGGPMPANLAARGPGEYYANVDYLDHQVGRLLAHLDRLHLRDDTVVVFTSDNGPVTRDWRHWYEVNLYGNTGDLRGRKEDLYDGGIRVPAIVRWPGHVAAGQVTDAPAIMYDLMPTLAAVAGVPVPTDRPIDGEDLAPLLRGEPFDRRQPLYWEYDDVYGFHFAIRDRRWKMLASRDFGRVQLYDLDTDRFEVVDRAESEPAVVARLLSALRERRSSVDTDPLRPAR